MGKALLVIDMPEKCDYCELLYHCHKDDEPYDPNAKPDWCPLREAPERDLSFVRNNAYHYQRGWNDCVNKILN